MGHTDKSGEEELVSFIIGLHNLDSSGVSRSRGAGISPTMTRQEGLEARIVVDTPIRTLDAAISRGDPHHTLIPDELRLRRS